MRYEAALNERRGWHIMADYSEDGGEAIYACGATDRQTAVETADEMNRSLRPTLVAVAREARLVTIEPATMASASFICANLRPLDHAEAFCQLPEGTRTHELAHAMLMSGDNYVVKLRDEPIIFFGASPMNAVCSSVWAIGTKRFDRGVPALMRFFDSTLGPKLRALGVTSLEARAMVEHEQAHRWIHLTGGVAHGPAFEYGRNGEKFVLFRWTETSISAAAGKRG